MRTQVNYYIFLALPLYNNFPSSSKISWIDWPPCPLGVPSGISRRIEAAAAASAWKSFFGTHFVLPPSFWHTYFSYSC
jgi:hypothetical protein